MKPYYLFIALKKSSLDLLCLSLSTKNSIASTGPICINILLKTHILERTSFSTNNSSFLVPDLVTSIDVTKSGTRKEELLVEKDVLSKMWVLRRILMQMGPVDAMEFLVDKLKQSKSNEDFFRAMNK